jgi:hypothetical protein
MRPEFEISLARALRLSTLKGEELKTAFAAK